ncbi:MAG: hypothetical protein AABY22_01465 [Nanoarchaeota archaeon]
MQEKLGYLPKEQRKKVLLICDDIRAFSGVATVAKEIVLHTARNLNWVNIAGSITHPEKGKKVDVSENTNQITGLKDSSVVLYPTDGYGDPNFVKQIIAIEKPDAIMLITDPRYFTWLFNTENEIRKNIPITYLNIWDSPFPYPLWNKAYYESCDLLMSISKQTYNLNKHVLGENKWCDINEPNRNGKTVLHYVPHGTNQNIFRPLDKIEPSLIKRKKEIMIKDVVGLINDCSEKTIQRELLTLVDEGILKKEGERRWTRYSLV